MDDLSQKLLLGGLVGVSSVLAFSSFKANPEKLSDLTVRTDYVSSDQSFVDAVVMLKPYANVAPEDFENMVKQCDNLAYYLIQLSGDGPVMLRYQHYSLHSKRLIELYARRLIDKVCRKNPDESQIAQDNFNALMTIVDIYVDDIQNQCIENAKRVNDF